MNDAPFRVAPAALRPINVAEDSANATAVSLGLSELAYSPGGRYWTLDESSQTLTYTITGLAGVQLFKSDGTTEVGPGSILTLTELRGLKYKTMPNHTYNGPGGVLWEVTDNGGTADGGVDTLTEILPITVTAINDPPTISPIADVTVRSGASTGPIRFTVADVDHPAATLTVTAGSDNTGLIPRENILLGGSDANRTVTIIPLSGKPGGTVHVTLTVSDGLASYSEEFSVFVTSAIAGDSNNDGYFNSDDMVLVFQGGEYEDDIVGNSTWAEGDWNGDGDFTSDDMVYAFQAGMYEVVTPPSRPMVMQPAAAASALPTDLADLALAADDLLDFDDLMLPTRRQSLKVRP